MLLLLFFFLVFFYFFYFLPMEFFFPLLGFSLLRYSLLVTPLLCLVTPLVDHHGNLSALFEILLAPKVSFVTLRG